MFTDADEELVLASSGNEMDLEVPKDPVEEISLPAGTRLSGDAEETPAEAVSVVEANSVLDSSLTGEDAGETPELVDVVKSEYRDDQSDAYVKISNEDSFDQNAEKRLGESDQSAGVNLDEPCDQYAEKSHEESDQSAGVTTEEPRDENSENSFEESNQSAGVTSNFNAEENFEELDQSAGVISNDSHDQSGETGIRESNQSPGVTYDKFQDAQDEASDISNEESFYQTPEKDVGTLIADVPVMIDDRICRECTALEDADVIEPEKPSSVVDKAVENLCEAVASFSVSETSHLAPSGDDSRNVVDITPETSNHVQLPVGDRISSDFDDVVDTTPENTQLSVCDQISSDSSDVVEATPENSNDVQLPACELILRECSSEVSETSDAGIPSETQSEAVKLDDQKQQVVDDFECQKPADITTQLSTEVPVPECERMSSVSGISETVAKIDVEISDTDIASKAESEMVQSDDEEQPMVDDFECQKPAKFHGDRIVLKSDILTVINRVRRVAESLNTADTTRNTGLAGTDIAGGKWTEKNTEPESGADVDIDSLSEMMESIKLTEVPPPTAEPAVTPAVMTCELNEEESEVLVCSAKDTKMSVEEDVLTEEVAAGEPEREEIAPPTAEPASRPAVMTCELNEEKSEVPVCSTKGAKMSVEEDVLSEEVAAGEPEREEIAPPTTEPASRPAVMTCELNEEKSDVPVCSTKDAKMSVEEEFATGETTHPVVSSAERLVPAVESDEEADPPVPVILSNEEAIQPDVEKIDNPSEGDTISTVAYAAVEDSMPVVELGELELTTAETPPEASQLSISEAKKESFNKSDPSEALKFESSVKTSYPHPLVTATDVKSENSVDFSGGLTANESEVSETAERSQATADQTLAERLSEIAADKTSPEDVRKPMEDVTFDGVERDLRESLPSVAATKTESSSSVKTEYSSDAVTAATVQHHVPEAYYLSRLLDVSDLTEEPSDTESKKPMAVMEPLAVTIVAPNQEPENASANVDKLADSSSTVYYDSSSDAFLSDSSFDESVCFVTMLKSPSSFYVQKLSSFAQLNEIEEKLREVSEDKLEDVEVGTMVGAKIQNMFLRVKVIDTEGYDGYTVFCVDYGTESTCPYLFKLPPELANMEALALHCAIPLPCYKREWPENVREEFESMTSSVEPTFTVRVLDSADDVVYVNLLKNGVDIGEKLRTMCDDLDSDSDVFESPIKEGIKF